MPLLYLPLLPCLPFFSLPKEGMFISIIYYWPITYSSHIGHFKLWSGKLYVTVQAWLESKNLDWDDVTWVYHPGASDSNSNSDPGFYPLAICWLSTVLKRLWKACELQVILYEGNTKKGLVLGFWSSLLIIFSAIISPI